MEIVVNGNIDGIETCLSIVRSDQSMFSHFEVIEEGLVGLQFSIQNIGIQQCYNHFPCESTSKGIVDIIVDWEHT